MKRWVWVLLGVGLLLMVLSGVCLYQYGGLKSFLQAVVAIEQLPVESRQQSRDNFYSGEQKNIYSGTLAGVTKIGTPRIWVWGDRGLKAFKTDQYTVYSFFSVCNQKYLQILAQVGIHFGVNQTIVTDLDLWTQKAKQGDFVIVMIAGSENGGDLGYAREVKANDWWAFMPTDIKKQCGK